MGFKEFLLAIFPRRWLNPNAPGVIRLLGGLGASLDEYDSLVKQVKHEIRVSTAVETIPAREVEYGLPVDPSLPIETRRANIIARKRERGGPVTKDDLVNMLRAYGLEVTILNDYNHAVMKIHVESPPGEPPGFRQIQAFVENVCRAHVGKEWELSYLTWDKLDNYLLKWDELDAYGVTWDEIILFPPSPFVSAANLGLTFCEQ
jgi:hypothetical protein